MEKLLLSEHPELKDYVSPLYLSAFPEDERPPLDYFYQMVNNFKENKVISYFDEGEFIGFAYLVFYQDVVYLAFFAVNENKRNQGYGSQIIQDIKSSFSNYVFLLCFEEVDIKYHDYQNRLRRQSFYIRNGFIDNHMKTREGNVIYQSAYIGKHPVGNQVYKNIFDHTYSVGSSDRYLKSVE